MRRSIASRRSAIHRSTRSAPRSARASRAACSPGGDGDDVEVAVDALALGGGPTDAGAAVPDGCRPAQPPRSTATAADASSAAAAWAVGVGMMRIRGGTAPPEWLGRQLWRHPQARTAGTAGQRVLHAPDDSVTQRRRRTTRSRITYTKWPRMDVERTTWADIGGMHPPGHEEVAAFLAQHSGGTASDLEPLIGGLWSSAWAYRAGGEELVIRLLSQWPCLRMCRWLPQPWLGRGVRRCRTSCPMRQAWSVPATGPAG
jgi:hypothetical protein